MVGNVQNQGFNANNIQSLAESFLKEKNCEKALDTAKLINNFFTQDNTLNTIASYPYCVQNYPDTAIAAASQMNSWVDKDAALLSLVKTYTNSNSLNCEKALKAALEAETFSGQNSVAQAMINQPKCLDQTLELAKKFSNATPFEDLITSAIFKTALTGIVAISAVAIICCLGNRRAKRVHTE